MSKLNGFTLIELLFVLVILSIIVTITVPPIFSTLKKQEAEQLMTVFRSDVQFMQNKSIGSKDDIRMIFKSDHYVVTDYMTNNVLVKRSLPDHISIDPRTLDYVSFNDKGSIRYPGVVYIETAHIDYRLVFPLGKGRFYIDEK
ncbi:competence type IV pilus minor pilin ComGD [Virgibacillus sp. W0181]|uniref:competence type IV pilus minor pilin ComGD n=1 Tax=Virgibacillus sp. W0181 TaxID=3391581 RepID=UPI003F479B6C